MEPCSIDNKYISKQLEYVTKDHISMNTILFKLKMVSFFSGITEHYITKNPKPLSCSPSQHFF